MPIEGLPSSNQQAAAAGTGGVILSGFDRKVNKDKIPDAVEATDKTPFKNLLIEILDSNEIGEVNVKRERRPNEEELLYNQELKRLSDFKLNSVVSKKKEDKKKKIKTGEEEQGEGEEGQAPSRLEEFVYSGDRIKKIEEELLKEFVSLSAKKLVGRPINELDQVEIRLNELKAHFLEMGFSPQDLSYLSQKTTDMLKEAFLHIVKDKFFRSPQSQIDAANWILNSKSGRSISEFLSLLEIDNVTVSDEARVLANLDIQDVLGIAQYFHIDIDSFMGGLNKGSVDLDRSKAPDTYFHVMGLPSLKGLSPIADEYRNHKTEAFMEDSFFKRIIINRDVNKLKSDLADHGMDDNDINNIDEQSRRMAWLKTITLLKVHHIKRILTTSSSEFDKESGKIEHLMNKAEKLGHDIPKEGIKWIEASLVKMSLETALYKLELLKSLQKIGFDAQREKDISHLSRKIIDLSKKVQDSLKPH